MFDFALCSPPLTAELRVSYDLLKGQFFSFFFLIFFFSFQNVFCIIMHTRERFLSKKKEKEKKKEKSKKANWTRRKAKMHFIAVTIYHLQFTIPVFDG